MYVWVWPGVQVTGCTPFVIIALLSTAHLFLHPLRESLATKTCFRINLLVSDQEYININNIRYMAPFVQVLSEFGGFGLGFQGGHRISTCAGHLGCSL